MTFLNYLNGFSLLIIMLGIDSCKGWVPYLIMILNIGWFAFIGKKVKRWLNAELH